MIAKKVMIWLLYAACTSTLAQTQNSVIESSGGRIEVLGPNYAGNFPIGVNQARIVLYSLEGNRLQGATSVFVNGNYHASLIKGAYSDLCYSPGDVELGARQAQVGQLSRDLPDNITSIRLTGGMTHYLRVQEQDGRPILQPVQPSQAQRELPDKRLQLHTISRVAQDCVEVKTAVAQPVRKTLSADVLFAFARADRQAITANGVTAIEQLIQQLRSEFTQIDHLNIVGHADPLGDKALNERLSIERARTVRQYIENTGNLKTSITDEGRGSREPIVVGCGTARTPKVQACNQPNRRVVVEVTGVRN